jgi:hypothetical protein
LLVACMSFPDSTPLQVKRWVAFVTEVGLRK